MRFRCCGLSTRRRRGIGKKSIETLLNHAILKKVPLWHLISGKADRPKLTTPTNRGLDQLARIVEDVAYQETNDSLVDLARNMVETTQYRSELGTNLYGTG